MWLVPGVCGLLVKKSWVAQEVLPNIPKGKGLHWYIDFAAVHKQGSPHITSQWFLSNMLFLVLMKVYSKIEWLLTYPIHMEFLPTVCFLVLSQVKNVTQDWATYLIEVGLLGRQTCLNNLDLWASLIRNTLFRKCLLILFSRPTTWKQRNAGDIHTDFVQRKRPITNVGIINPGMSQWDCL